MEFYLLNLTVSGIKCIKDKVRLDFYKKTINNDFNPEKYKVKAIYGENGAGKSAIITAVKIFHDMMVRQQYLSDPQKQILLEEIVNKVTRKFTFEIEFIAYEKKVYKYSFEVEKSDTGSFEVTHEKLQVRSAKYTNSRYVIVYYCRDGKIVKLNCDSELKNKIEMLTMNLLEGSLLSCLIVNKIEVENENNSILYDCVAPFILGVDIIVYLDAEDEHETYLMLKNINEKEFAFQNARGLYSVSQKMILKERYEDYKNKVQDLARFLKIFKHGLENIQIDKKEYGSFYKCELNLDYGDYQINSEFESTGIKKLIRMFDCLDAAANGGIVFIDEMDSNLNDVYLCRIIEYFMYYGKGQVCFTTHNIDPMSVLKKNKNSIDFLSSDNKIIPWVQKGHASPENFYKNGMIENVPFNIEATDFIGILGE